MSNISFSIVGIMYNMQLMDYAGENGIAAFGVMMYVSMIFMAVFIGYAIGTVPIFGYNYGASNKEKRNPCPQKEKVWVLKTNGWEIPLLALR